MKGWREHGREWNFSEWLKNYNKVTMRTGLELVLTIKSILNVLVILYARWCVTLRPLRFTDSFRKNGRDIHNTGRFVKLKKKNKYKILESRIIIIIFFFIYSAIDRITFRSRSSIYDNRTDRLDRFLFVLSSVVNNLINERILHTFFIIISRSTINSRDNIHGGTRSRCHCRLISVFARSCFRILLTAK